MIISLNGFNFTLPSIPEYATNNAHMLYFNCSYLEDRTDLIEKLSKEGINAVFHYQSLHRSEYVEKKHDGIVLKQTDRYSDSLVRLPFYYALSQNEIDKVSRAIIGYYE